MGFKDTIKGSLGLIRAKIFCVTAGKGVYIGKHCSLKGKHNITLEDSVTVRPYAQIWSGGVSIGDDTWIGTNVVIAGTVEIGKHCVIDANSVVTHDIPDYSVVAGCPARVIKQIKKYAGE